MARPALCSNFIHQFKAEHSLWLKREAITLKFDHILIYLYPEQPLDLVSVVEELNGVSSKEISKLLKDSENFTIQCDTGRGFVRQVSLQGSTFQQTSLLDSPWHCCMIQVDMEKLAASLPLHLIAVLLSSDDGMRLAHLLRGVRLLHSLCDAASRHSRLEQVFCTLYM